MRTFIISSAFIFSFLPYFAEAHIPIVLDSEIKTPYEVTDPTVSKAYYGELAGGPHTYEIIATEPFNLYVQVLVPDIVESENIIGSIITRINPDTKRAESVARLNPEEASWVSYFEFFGGDHYREGPSFSDKVPAGTYRIEVNTPDNVGKYVLVVGTVEDFSDIGFFSLIQDIARVKVFFGKSELRIIESPFVYVPLSVILLGSLSVWFVVRRRRRVV